MSPQQLNSNFKTQHGELDFQTKPFYKLLNPSSRLYTKIMQVTIEPHNPAWITEFSRVRDELQNILSDVQIISIEHVGSTSIPDLVAKPVLDINIMVTAENVEAASKALVRAGYTARGDLGVPERYAFRQPEVPREAGVVQGMKRNTYVCVDGCLSVRNHRDLKRVLSENEGLRQEYGDVKKRLVARNLTDVDEYCRGKNEVVLKILSAAGWSEEELDEVRRANM